MKKLLVTMLVMVAMSVGTFNIAMRVESLEHRAIPAHRHIFNIGDKLPDVIRTVYSTLVYVECDNFTSGSGVVVAHNKVLTAAHVVRDSMNIVITVNGTQKEVTALRWEISDSSDCAVIYFEDSTFTNIAGYANSDLAVLGQRIFTVTSPYGEDFIGTVSEGIVSNTGVQMDMFGETDCMLIDATAWNGSSGGPVFDMRGRVIGIVVGRFRDRDSGIIVTPSKICKDFINANQNSDQD